MLWVWVTLFAAVCQSFRTAHQNTLSQQQGLLHATMARSLYGLPLVSLYGVICWFVFGNITAVPPLFWLYASICAVAQMLATYLMLRVFKSGGFALGTLLAKTEAIQAAVISIPLLHHLLSGLDWLAIVLGVIGAVVMSVKWENLRHAHKDISLLLGLASGFCFAVTAVMVSLSSHTLKGDVMTNAAVTLWYVLALQSVILCSLQIAKTRNLKAPFIALSLSNKVGVLSALGSIGWFTGFALVNPALVKTLGQVEIVGMLYFSKRRFQEQISAQQWLGGLLILTSVILVVV